jgi:hypothetical protein
MKTGPHEVNPENVQPITKDQLKDSEKAELDAHMKHYEELSVRLKVESSRRVHCQRLSKSPFQPILKASRHDDQSNASNND